MGNRPSISPPPYKLSEDPKGEPYAVYALLDVDVSRIEDELIYCRIVAIGSERDRLHKYVRCEGKKVTGMLKVAAPIYVHQRKSGMLDISRPAAATPIGHSRVVDDLGELVVHVEVDEDDAPQSTDSRYMRMSPGTFGRIFTL